MRVFVEFRLEVHLRLSWKVRRFVLRHGWLWSWLTWFWDRFWTDLQWVDSFDVRCSDRFPLPLRKFKNRRLWAWLRHVRPFLLSCDHQRSCSLHTKLMHIHYNKVIDLAFRVFNIFQKLWVFQKWVLSDVDWQALSYDNPYRTRGRNKLPQFYNTA